MEFEQIVKQLEWLDTERRKSKEAIAVLEERLAAMDSTVDALSAQIRASEQHVSELSSLPAKIEQLDSSLPRLREDFTGEIERLEKDAERRSATMQKRHEEDLESLRKAFADLRKETSVKELKSKISTLSTENIRLRQEIKDLAAKVEEATQAAEETRQALRVSEEARRQDLKRLSSAQGEVAALRKRMEEQREKIELNAHTLRTFDTQIREITSAEADRKKEQAAFFEKLSLAELERERVWKSWTENYQNLREQSKEIESHLQALSEATRAAKKAEETFAEITQRLERRVNEITEIQRLGEERLRQEWVAFKADDQKRWTGYTLSQEEVLRDIHKTLEQVNEHLTLLDDSLQTLQDQLQQTVEISEDRMQSLMNWAHEWLTGYERVMGQSPKTT
jgi:chromosome segregation ATPase